MKKISSIILVISLMMAYTFSVSASDDFVCNFDGALSSSWVWVNENLHNDSISNGHLVLNANVPGANSSENMLYFNQMLSDDFECIVKFKPNATTGDGQRAGIFIWQNWNNKFQFRVEGKGNEYMIINHDSNSSGWPQIIPDSDGYVYFKIVREDNKYSFYYSSDNVNYTKKCVQTLNFSNACIGLYCQKESNNPAFQAEFDYITVKTLNKLVDQVEINELPNDVPYEDKLNVVGLTPREDIVPGDTMTIKFNNELSVMPAFKISKGGNEIQGAVESVNKIDGFTYSLKISETALLDEGQIYTLYVTATDFYGNNVKNNASFKTFKNIVVPEGADNQYSGFVYDIGNSDEFNDGSIDSRWDNAEAASCNGGNIEFNIEPGINKLVTSKISDEGDAIIEIKASVEEAMKAHDDKLIFSLYDNNGRTYRLEWCNNASAGYLLAAQVDNNEAAHHIFDSNRTTVDLIAVITRKDGKVSVDLSCDNRKSWINISKDIVWTDEELNIKLGGEAQSAGDTAIKAMFDYIRVYVPRITEPKVYVGNDKLSNLISGQYNVSVKSVITDFSGEQSYVMICALARKDENNCWENVSVSKSDVIVPRRKTPVSVDLAVDIEAGAEGSYEIKSYLWDELSVDKMHSMLAQKGENTVNVASVTDMNVVYSDQEYLNITGELDKDCGALVTVLITDEQDNVVHIEERQISSGKEIDFNIKLNKNLPGGEYTISLSSNDGTLGVSDDFTYVSNVSAILDAINLSLNDEHTFDDFITALGSYSDELGLSSDKINGIRTSTYLELKACGTVTKLSDFVNELLLCENLCDIATVQSETEVEALTNELLPDLLSNEELVDYYKLNDRSFVYRYIYEAAERNRIDAQNRDIFILIFDKAVAIELLNEINGENRSSVIDVFEKYNIQLGLSQTDKWNYYIGLALEDKERIAVSFAAKTLEGEKFNVAQDVIYRFNDVVTSHINEYQAPTYGSVSGGRGSSSKNSLPVLSDNSHKDITSNVTGVFDDLEGFEWAIEYIQTLYNKKIIDGVGNNKFAPQNNITREQVVKILVETLGLNDSAEVAFKDVDRDHWAYEYISKAVNAGIVKGISEEEFGVGQSITRQDIAVMVFRALEYNSELSSDKQIPSFSDNDMISSYAINAIGYLSEREIVSGKGNNQFEPLSYATRAECAVIIAKIIEQFSL